MRFYMIPGFGHGFGPFNAKIDSLKALQNWVEKGRAPIGAHGGGRNPNANASRPLCEWPKFPSSRARRAREQCLEVSPARAVRALAAESVRNLASDF